MNLYEILGVPKTATKKEIRNAYRKKAKKAHPDHGGTMAEFALIKKAHDILTNDKRREKYDSTGDDSEEKVDNKIADAVNVLAGFLDVVVGGMYQRGADPIRHNIIQEMKFAIKAEIEKADEAIAKVKSDIPKVKKLQGRFKKKKGQNFMEDILTNKFAAINIAVGNIEKQRQPLKDAYDMLKDYSFDMDESYDAEVGAPKMIQWMMREMR